MNIARPRVLIISNATTTITGLTGGIRQLVIAMDSVGTAWNLQIHDNNSYVLVPKFTMASPSDGQPLILKFDWGVEVNGLKAETTGTPAGSVSIWAHMETGDVVIPSG